MEIFAYKETRRIRVRSARALARFLRGTAGAGGMVRVLRCQEGDVEPPQVASGLRKGIDRRDHRAVVCPPLGNRAVVPQPQALVGDEQFVAAISAGLGAVDDDPLLSLVAGPTPGVGGGRSVSDHGHRALAQGRAHHRRFGGPVAPRGICRGCVPRGLGPEVPDIYLPGRARRPATSPVTG
jgi:hypothetical protein